MAFFSLEDETAGHEEQEETDEGDDYKNKTESESNRLLVGMKRHMDSESCGHYVR